MGGVLVLLAGVALVALAWRMPVPPETVPAPRRRGIAPLGLGAWLFLETAILANPFGLARWDGADARLAVVACVAGLLAGAWLATHGMGRGALLGLNAAALLFALDHGLVHSPLAPLGALVAQAALVADAAAFLAPLGTFTASARAFGLGAGVMMLLHFLLIFAFTFAYVPLSGAWHGLERFLPALGVLLAAAAALVVGRPAARAWMPRRAAAALLVVLLLAAAVPLARPAEPVAAPAGGTLRVMTFNLHQAFDNDGALDPEVFVRIVHDANPDVAVLQEYDATRISSGNVDLVSILAERLGYHSYYGPPSSAEGFSGAVLSRHPIAEARWLATPTTSDNRYVTETRLDVGGRPVWLYGVHFGLPAADRAAQLGALLGAASARTGPRLLVGDFNACPAIPCDDADGGHVYWTLASSGWRDAWVAAGHGANDTAGYTYSSLDPTERIDHVWASPEWAVVSATVVRSPDAKAASDHAPVVAELRLAG
jgi:endonuclease/exonuclease/phosphatase family metal-dependent hydrolase